MKRCCISTLISLFVVIVLLVVGVVVLLNLTPAKLHLADVEIMGSTISEMGLADAKFIDIIKGVRALGAKESDVVKNAYNAETEQAAAAEAFAHSNANGQYDKLLDDQAVFDKRYLLIVNDTTLAYVVDQAIGAAYTYQVDGQAQAAMSVREVTVSKLEGLDGSNRGYMRVVVGVSVGAFVNSAITDVTDKVNFKMPQYVYVVFEGDFDVVTSGENKGKMTFSTTKATLAGKDDNPLTGVVLKLVCTAAGISTDDTTTAEQQLCNDIFGKMSSCVSHVGLIGSAYTLADGEIAGEVEYGLKGLAEHKLYLVTKTAE